MVERLRVKRVQFVVVEIAPPFVADLHAQDLRA
jgi:hypothetical protein